MRSASYLIRTAFLVVALIVLSYGKPAVADLVGFWSFDDETADDLSGNGNDGFVNGAVEFRDDTPTGDGYSVYFPGAGGNNIQVPHSDSLDIAHTMTIAYWIKAENLDQGTADWNGPMSKSAGDPRIGWEFQRWEADSRIDIRLDTDQQENFVFGNLTGTFDDEWMHVAWTVDEGLSSSYLNGEWIADGTYNPGDGFANDAADVIFGCRAGPWCAYVGSLDEIAIYDEVISDDEIMSLAEGNPPIEAPPASGLMPGDADQNLEFNQLDLVKVQVAAKYLTGAAATWGEGDWDGAPGGSVGNPPAGNGFFDQLDIVAALNADVYLKGPYAAINTGGQVGDGQTSITYDPSTGELGVDAPAGTDLTSINIDSAGAIFTGAAAENLGGSFDNDADDNIFKATFGSSFGSLSFGNVAQAGLSEDFVANDLTVVGSLAGGGALGDVDLIYVPEPSTMVMLGVVVGLVMAFGRFRRAR